MAFAAAFSPAKGQGSTRKIPFATISGRGLLPTTCAAKAGVAVTHFLPESGNRGPLYRDTRRVPESRLAHNENRLKDALEALDAAFEALRLADEICNRISTDALGNAEQLWRKKEPESRFNYVTKPGQHHSSESRPGKDNLAASIQEAEAVVRGRLTVRLSCLAMPTPRVVRDQVGAECAVSSELPFAAQRVVLRTSSVNSDRRRHRAAAACTDPPVARQRLVQRLTRAHSGEGRPI
eukprot:g20636.t1